MANGEYQEIIARLTSLQESGAKAPAIDPTANVLALVAAESRRQDNLRDLTDKCAHELNDVRLKAAEDLRLAESKRIDALMLAESRRFDALLDAAADAVKLASTRAELTATALAERVDASAKTLAQSVVASAEALAAKVATTTESIGSRLTLLEQSQYRIGGRDTQRSEGRQTNQWTIGLLVAVVFALAGLALKVF